MLSSDVNLSRPGIPDVISGTQSPASDGNLNLLRQPIAFLWKDHRIIIPIGRSLFRSVFRRDSFSPDIDPYRPVPENQISPFLREGVQTNIVRTVVINKRFFIGTADHIRSRGHKYHSAVIIIFTRHTDISSRHSAGQKCLGFFSEINVILRLCCYETVSSDFQRGTVRRLRRPKHCFRPLLKIKSGSACSSLISGDLSACHFESSAVHHRRAAAEGPVT